MKEIVLCSVWILVIFSSIPFGNQIANAIVSFIAPPQITVLLLILVFIVALGFIYWLRKSGYFGNTQKLITGLVIILIYTYYFATLISMVEKLHFFEYGILSLLLLRAISKKSSNGDIYFYVLFAVYMTGLADETIQWLDPKRTGEYKDVLLNTGSGLLPLIACRHIFGYPKNVSHANLLPSLRRFLTICHIILIFTALFIDATNEFGYKHRVGRLTFYSRFTINELSIESEIHSDKYKKDLQSMSYVQSENKYNDLYSRFNKREFPLMHEVSVHIARRERYLNPDRLDPYIAYSENEVLEEAYKGFIEGTSFYWSGDKKSSILGFEPSFSQTSPFISPVSKELITRFTRKTFWIIIFLVDVTINIIFFLIKKRDVR